MKRSFVFWVERYFYTPSLAQKLLSTLLLPLSWVYCFAMFVRYKTSKRVDLGIDIVGVGNLSVGGSGKTPLVTALALKYADACVVLRGYGRESKGMQVVKDRDSILCDVGVSGDEAMIYAHKLPDAMVIVSEDRKKAILKAKELGAKIVFLDDAYSKHDIKKLDFLIDVKTKNNSCLPSGAFRERLWRDKEAYILKENKEFTRVVELKNKTAKMSLVTAIARPSRLDEFLPEVVSKNYFEDHHSFKKKELEEILEKDRSDSLLVTYKDFVKIQGFDLPISLLDLEVIAKQEIFDKIKQYRKK